MFFFFRLFLLSELSLNNKFNYFISPKYFSRAFLGEEMISMISFQYGSKIVAPAQQKIDCWLRKIERLGFILNCFQCLFINVRDKKRISWKRITKKRKECAFRIVGWVVFFSVVPFQIYRFILLFFYISIKIERERERATEKSWNFL